MTTGDASERRRCVAKNSRGEPCGQRPIRGGTVCRTHGGSTPQVRARAAVRAELETWTLGDATMDPGEVLLRLVTQSAGRVALYGHLLQDAYEAAERLAEAERVDDSQLSSDAQRDLDLVLQTGGVGALIGKTYSAAGKDGVIFASGEAIRGLAKLESDERDRCANFAAKAVAAGLAERQVRAAERVAAVFVAIHREACEAAGVDVGQLRVIEGVVLERVAELGGAA